MPSIEKLISKYCPNGTNHKSLNDLGVFFSGLSGKTKKDFENGNCKFATYMNVYKNPALNLDIKDMVCVEADENQNYLKLGDVLFTGSSETPDECGLSSVVSEEPKEKIYLNSFCFGYRLNDTSLFLPDFLKHLFRSDNLRRQISKTANGVTRFNVSKTKFGKIIIPVPPLAVQEEIVNILDSFTMLEAELEAELEARKKQYEHYRDNLLNFADISQGEVRIMALCDILDYEQPSKYIVDSTDYVESGTPVLTAGQTFVLGYTNEEHGIYAASKEDPVIIFDDFTTANKWVDFNFKVKSSAMKMLKCKTKDVLLRFVYFMMTNMQTSTMEHSRQWINKYSQIKIPVPPLAEQERIVSILDKFDALVNDISDGLPAEINARRQQYEYYRDKLLNFEPMAA